MSARFVRAILTALTLSLTASSAFADGPKKLDPTDIGNFDKRQFIADAQASTLGKDITDILGNLAYANKDGTLTVMHCRKTVGTLASVTSADLSQPIFSAVIDGNWGMKVTLSFLNINSTGNVKTTVTATDVADAALPPANIPDTITSPVPNCSIPPNNAQLYYIEKATLSLINKTTYVKTDNSGGILSFLNISGATYEEQDTSNEYKVSVFATIVLPAAAASNTLTVAKTQAQLMSLAVKNIKALGVDKAINGKAPALGVKYTTYLKPAKLEAGLAQEIKHKANAGQ